MKYITLYSPGERSAAFWMVFSAILFSSSAALLPRASWFTAVYSNALYVRERRGARQSSLQLPSFQSNYKYDFTGYDVTPKPRKKNYSFINNIIYQTEHFLYGGKLTFPWFESRIWATFPATAPPYNRKELII